LSAVRDCLFNVFLATLHIGGPSFIRNLRTRHAMATGTHWSQLSQLQDRNWKPFVLRGKLLTSVHYTEEADLRVPRCYAVYKFTAASVFCVALYHVDGQSPPQEPQISHIHWHMILTQLFSRTSNENFHPLKYEGWNFNIGNYLFTTDTK